MAIWNFSKMVAAAIFDLFEPEIAPLDPPSPAKTLPRTKHEVDRMTRCGDMTIWNFSKMAAAAILDFVRNGNGAVRAAVPQNHTLTNASAHLVQYRLKIRGGNPEGVEDYGGKDLWKRWVLSLEWKAEGVTDGENKGDDCDEVICAGCEPGGEWT